MTTDDDRGTRLHAELEAALEAVAQQERALARLQRAQQAEAAARTSAVAAHEALAGEAADVQRLESYSPTRILAALRGSRDADLDRERAQQQAAQYAVARADALLSSAHEETRRAEAELVALGDVAGRRQRALEAKEQWLAAAGGDAAERLTGVAEELATTRADATEVQEAAEAAAVAAERLDAARHQLGAAGDWATYDTFLGGGMFTDAMKYDRMDQAQRLLHAADQALRHLTVELADVGMEAVVHGLAVDGLTQTFDVWFDNIFTDWSVRSRIADAARGADEAAALVHEVRVRLHERQRELADREHALAEERERLVSTTTR